MIRALFLFCSLCLSSSAFATIQLPKSMPKNDRVTALQIIGLGTSGKLLTDPYPLGGYAGFEAGVSVESFGVEDLGRLGSKLTPPQQDVTVPKLTFGKGLYNNVDLFLHFTPYNRQDELTQYGGMVRWGFYQASFLPLSLSVLGHLNTLNLANQLTTRTYGFDLVGGANVDNVAIYAGLGYVESHGTFEGGATQITDSSQEENELVSGLHGVVGADIRFSNLFLALAIDRYTVTVFSGKLGVRF